MRAKPLVSALLVATAAFALACADQSVAPERRPALRGPAALVVDAREGADPAIIEQVVQMYNTGFSGGGWAVAGEIYAPDYVPHMPGLPQVTDLASLIAELTLESYMVAPDYHITLEDVFGSGDEVVGRFTATANWVFGVPEPVPYVHPFIVVFRFENGKIAEEWWQFDMLGVQEQLGALPRTRPSYGWSAPSTLTGDPGIPQQNASLARRAMQTVNTGNPVLGDQVFSPGYVNHDPAVPLATDWPSYRSVIEAQRAAFPDLRLTIEDVIASGDRVALRVRWTGTQLGPFNGIPATGRHVEIGLNVIYRVADGQIVEGWDAYDVAGLIQQLLAP